MITGRVAEREASIQLTVRGPRKRERKIRAVIDTGYTAFLSLPPALIAVLGLQWKSSGRGILADGSECLFDVYVGEVVWDGKDRVVPVDEADTDPLVGMALLNGYELKSSFRRPSHRQTTPWQVGSWNSTQIGSTTRHLLS